MSDAPPMTLHNPVKISLAINLVAVVAFAFYAGISWQRLVTLAENQNEMDRKIADQSNRNQQIFDRLTKLETKLDILIERS